MKELNEFLAVEVMGWLPSRESTIIHAAYFDPKKYDEKFASDEQGYEFLIKDWNPSKNIKQAIMCANIISKTEEVIISICDGETWCKIGHGQTTVGFADQKKSTPLAISLACARAKGWKDE